MSPRRVIVTRPAREAARWVDALRAHGFDAVALPLFAIEPPHDVTAVRMAWTRLGDYAALMFVSAQAVEHFFQYRANAEASPAGLRWWATGPGTTQALRSAGVEAAWIDAPPADAPAFDSEALWVRVRPQIEKGKRVLIVRGGDAHGQATGRPWLAREIEAAGGICDTLVSYLRLAPSWNVAQREWAHAASIDGSVWLFSSSQAIGHLMQALPDVDWHGVRAVATHERIAQAAREAGFGGVDVAQTTLEAVIASIKSAG